MPAAYQLSALVLRTNDFRPPTSKNNAPRFFFFFLPEICVGKQLARTDALEGYSTFNAAPKQHKMSRGHWKPREEEEGVSFVVSAAGTCCVWAGPERFSLRAIRLLVIDYLWE